MCKPIDRRVRVSCCASLTPMTAWRHKRPFPDYPACEMISLGKIGFASSRVAVEITFLA
jgi:hypothetical protein